MKTHYFLILFTAILPVLVSNTFGQTYVNTQPVNKNVILEEFTGVRCPNCPQGHQTAQQIMDNNPDRVWVIAFHPFNSSFTTPYPGSPDLRRNHPDAFYTIPYCGTSRFMPSAFINRRKYGADRLQSRTIWESKTTEHLAEPSPVNVGLFTAYDETTNDLTIIAEIFYTQTVTDEHTLNITLSESGIVAEQANGGTNYVHKHVFREVFTAQWGDVITEPTTQGSFIQKTFTFNNSAGNYNMDECEVVAYIVNSATEEVVSGIGVHVGDYTVYVAPVADFSADNTLVPAGNTAEYSDLSTGVIETWEWVFEGGTPATFSGQNPPPVTYNTPGTFEVSLTVSNNAGSHTETKSDYIVVDHPPVADFSHSHQHYTGYTEVSFTDISSGNPVTWEWTFENGDPAASGEQNPLVTYTVPGEHQVTLTVTSPFGQDTHTKTVPVEIITGMANISSSSLKVYPNPANSQLIISLPFQTQIEMVCIFDLAGNEISQKALKTHAIQYILDVSQLTPGCYIVKLVTISEVMTSVFKVAR